MMTRNQITAFLGLSVALWAGLLLWRGIPVTLPLLAPFSIVVGAVSGILLAFDRWVWHWPVFRGWLVRRPYLHGTWRAEIVSDWVDPSTGTGIPPIMAFMVVRQTGSALSLRLLTPESRSESVSAGVEVCTDGTFEINVAYRNRPGSPFRHRSEVHYGAMLLTTESSTPARLEGEYWTDRKTIGSVTLTDRRRGHPTTFTEAEGAFAASD